MNAEGVATIVTAEWVQTVLTSVPMVVVGAWVVYGPLVLWRRLILSEVGADMRTLAARWRCTVSPWWAGWRIHEEGRMVHWSGGLRGARTVVHKGEWTKTFDGWLTADDIEGL